MSSDSDNHTDRFLEFSNARDLPDIYASFSSLCKEIQLDPLCYENFYPTLKSKLQHWKSKSLWDLLDARAALPEYCGQTACKGKRVLVIGAGPVGLRVAIEAAMLGAEVDVVEKRNSFSRNNVLHLWPFLIDDLRALGAKKFYGKFCAGAIDHICIRILQSILLKLCLVLGVKIHFPVKFVDLVEPKSSDGNWSVAVDPSTSPLSSKHYNAILSADGKKYSLPGFQSKEFRARLAIAITANFTNQNTDEEVAVEEISGVSYIYNQSFFNTLSAKHGIDLENIVYYKDETHYFVMTAKKTSLLSKGVLKKDYSDPEMLLSRNNVNQTALEKYAVEAATYSTKGGLTNLQFATNHRGKKDVAVFDFTSLFASEHASQIMERKGKRILLCVVGDTLLEPFWPTGTGLARGFLGAFDAAWMLKQFCEGKAPLELIEEREALFHLLPSTTPQRLHKKTSSYTINPHTRYPNFSLVPPSDISYLFDSDTQPSRRQQRITESPLTESKIQRFHSIGAQDARKIQPNPKPSRPSQSPERAVKQIEKAKDRKRNKEGSATPQHSSSSSSESYLMRFAKKLFGIKSSKEKQQEGEESEVAHKPPQEENKSTRRERKRTPSSPRKSPKRKRKKSKPEPADSKPQQHSDELPKEHQQQTTGQTKSPGVLELAKMYESGGASGQDGDHQSKDVKRSKMEERSSKAQGMEETAAAGRIEKQTQKVPKVERKERAQREEETRVKRAEETSKVSVASVIKRLEEYKNEGFNMTDYEIELMEFVSDGIEEVDSGILDTMEKHALLGRDLPEAKEMRPKEEEVNHDVSEGECLVEEPPNDGLRSCEQGPGEVNGGRGEEKGDETRKQLDMEEGKIVPNDGVSVEQFEKSATEQEPGERENRVNLEKEEDQLMLDTTTEGNVIYCNDTTTVLEDIPNPVDKKEPHTADEEVARFSPTAESEAQDQTNNIINTEEEAKVKMGLPPGVKTYTRGKENTKTKEPVSPFKSPIRRGSKDDSELKLKDKTQKTIQIPTWQKRFILSLTLILEKFRNETDLQSFKTALEIINFIYKNTVDDPLEDTYRRVRVVSSRFMTHVWQYSCAQLFLLGCGWMEVDDYLVLPMEQSLEIPLEVIGRQIEIVDMMMQSQHFSHAMSRQQNPQAITGEEDTYTDSIVLRGVAKAHLDCSVQIARNMKGSKSTQESEADEDTDHPWISKKEELVIMESASQARQWWEKKTLTRHPSTYSLYFQEEELDQLKYLAGLEDNMRGKVAERVKELEGRNSRSSDDDYSTASTDQETSSSGEEDKENEEEEEMSKKEGMPEADDSLKTEIDSSCTEQLVTCKDVREMWKERSEGVKSPVSDKVSPNKAIKLTEDESPSETMLKWESAQRVAEQLALARQKSKKDESLR